MKLSLKRRSSRSSKVFVTHFSSNGSFTANVGLDCRCASRSLAVPLCLSAAAAPKLPAACSASMVAAAAWSNAAASSAFEGALSVAAFLMALCSSFNAFICFSSSLKVKSP